MALKNVRAALIDLSGTLHIEDKATPGAIEALERLRNNNVKVRFVTNTTKESKEVLWRRLTSIGFNIQKNEIFTSLTAARELVEARQLRSLLMLEDEALEDFDGIKTENPNAVVVGLAPSKFGYDSMNAAFRLILAGASLIAIHKGRYYKKKDCLALGPGPFVAALEYATDSKAEVVGKPEPAFFLKSLEYLDSIPAETAMIGDDVVDDIGGAQNVGMKGILVKTGKYRFGDENKICPNPSFVCDSFSDAVKHILED